MKAYVGITDLEWYRLLSQRSGLDEVNFWQPGGNRLFRALQPGELFLFKLHSPRNYVVGGGLFAHSTLLPVSLAWTSFAEANGVGSLAEMRARIERYRRSRAQPQGDYTIGCIILVQPFFLPESIWIRAPADWHPNLVQGRGYDLDSEPGRTLWQRVQDAVKGNPSTTWLPEWHESNTSRYGEPTLVQPRLGQGAFRVLVTDTYGRRCTVTGERVLPVLEAAHIQPYGRGGEHRIDNGLLLRSDLHTLFDRGYLTIGSDLRVEVSNRLREDFENGRDYYALHGRGIRAPEDPRRRPAPAFLRWHNEEAFLG